MSEEQNMSKQPPRGPGHGHGPGPRMVEKPKNFKKAMGKLILFIKPFLLPVAIALVFAVAGTVLNLLGPDVINKLTNVIKSSFTQNGQIGVFAMDMQKVLRLCLFLVVIYGAGLICSYIQGVIMATVTQKNSRNLRTAISKKINLLPLRYFDSHSIGDVLSRVTNDVDTIGMTLNQSVVTFVTAVVMLVGSVVMMFITDWLMALTAIAASFVGFIVMFVIMGKSQKYFARQQRYLGEINGHIEESYAGHNVIKAYNAERKVKNVFNETNYKLYTSAWKSQFLSGLMMPLMNFIGNLGYVAVCVVGLDDVGRFDKAAVAERNGVKVPVYYLRGWIDRSKLNIIDKTVLLAVCVMMKLKGLNQYNQPVFDAMMEGGSFYDEKFLDPVTMFVESRR